MARVSFTANLQRHVPAPPVEAIGATVREVLDVVFAGNPRLRGYVLDERGALRKHMVIFVDGRMVEDRLALGDTVLETSEVYVMQSLSGGKR